MISCRVCGYTLYLCMQSGEIAQVMCIDLLGTTRFIVAIQGAELHLHCKFWMGDWSFIQVGLHVWYISLIIEAKLRLFKYFRS